VTLYKAVPLVERVHGGWYLNINPYLSMRSIIQHSYWLNLKVRQSKSDPSQIAAVSIAPLNIEYFESRKYLGITRIGTLNLLMASGTRGSACHTR
jgi:hypothetical protein